MSNTEKLIYQRVRQLRQAQTKKRRQGPILGRELTAKRPRTREPNDKKRHQMRKMTETSKPNFSSLQVVTLSKNKENFMSGGDEYLSVQGPTHSQVSPVKNKIRNLAGLRKAKKRQERKVIKTDSSRYYRSCQDNSIPGGSHDILPEGGPPNYRSHRSQRSLVHRTCQSNETFANYSREEINNSNQYSRQQVQTTPKSNKTKKSQRRKSRQSKTLGNFKSIKNSRKNSRGRKKKSTPKDNKIGDVGTGSSFISRRNLVPQNITLKNSDLNRSGSRGITIQSINSNKTMQTYNSSKISKLTPKAGNSEVAKGEIKRTLLKIKRKQMKLAESKKNKNSKKSKIFQNKEQNSIQNTNNHNIQLQSSTFKSNVSSLRSGVLNSPRNLNSTLGMNISNNENAKNQKHLFELDTEVPQLYTRDGKKTPTSISITHNIHLQKVTSPVNRLNRRNRTLQPHSSPTFDRAIQHFSSPPVRQETVKGIEKQYVEVEASSSPVAPLDHTISFGDSFFKVKESDHSEQKDRQSIDSFQQQPWFGEDLRLKPMLSPESIMVSQTGPSPSSRNNPSFFYQPSPQNRRRLGDFSRAIPVNQDQPLPPNNLLLKNLTTLKGVMISLRSQQNAFPLK